MRLSSLLRALRVEEPENILPPDRMHRRNHCESLLNPKHPNSRPADASRQSQPPLE